MRNEGSIVGTLVFILFGPIVWALHLAVSYGAHASLCAVAEQGTANTSLAIALGSATLVAAVLLGMGAVRPSVVAVPLHAVPPASPESAFTYRLMQILVLLSLLGVVFAGLVMLILPLCSTLR